MLRDFCHPPVAARFCSYDDVFKFFVFSGGQGVNRTLDTRIFSPLLYRLSYLAGCGDIAWTRIKPVPVSLVKKNSIETSLLAIQRGRLLRFLEKAAQEAKYFLDPLPKFRQQPNTDQNKQDQEYQKQNRVIQRGPKARDHRDILADRDRPVRKRFR